MVKATINGIPVEVAEGTSILVAAKQAQVKIPTLCAHQDLTPSASCGICVVKVKGMNKMLRSCSTPLEEGMDILTHDPEIVETRRTVLELILSAHPNDCLKCGRNQNCELQTLVADFGIREEVFDKAVRDLPMDKSTGSIVLEPSKCIKCGRCVEVCQDMQNVWALSFLERGIKTRISPAGDITLNQSPCVKCGQCSAHCPTGAIFEQDDTMKTWQILQDSGLYPVVQIAPSVRVAIGEGFGYPLGTNLTKKLYAVLRRLGFRAVFDTNFGADVTIMEEAAEFISRLLHAKGPLPLITTCCPSWVDYMEKFYTDMIDHFSSVKSPHEISGILSKTYFAQKNNMNPEKIRVISVMPCTAKKYEITRTDEMFASGFQDVDVVLTTRELVRMIKQAGLDFTNLEEEEPDHILGAYSGAGTIFGATGGVMEAALRTAYSLIAEDSPPKIEFTQVRGLQGIKETSVVIKGTEVKIAVAHGLANVSYVLDKVREALKRNMPLPYHFIEVMACPGGCIGGGGQPYQVNNDVRIKRSEGLYADDKMQKTRCSHDNPYIKKLYEEFLGMPLGEKSHRLLHTTYKPRPEYRK